VATRVTELILYGRRGCHLCDELRLALLEFQSEYRFRLREIDIDADPELRARYGPLIPVLCLGDREICHFHLDPAALKQALEAR
jgi:thiol-disulfide isomerase/thioredoxin